MTRTSPTLVDLVAATVERGADQLLLTGPDDAPLTYGDAWTAAGRMANALRAEGARPGDRVALQVQKSAAVISLYLARLRAGAVHLPMSVAYTPDEVGHLLGDAEPTLFVRDPGLAPVDTVVRTVAFDDDGVGPLTDLAAEQSDEVDGPKPGPDDVAALLYTSGTTGRPKGAPLTQAALAANALALRDAWGFTADDVLVHVLPLHHAHGLFISMGCTLASGSSLRFFRGFDADTTSAAFGDATVFMGVPTHYVRLLATDGLDREHTAGMRLFVSGSAPLLARTHTAFAERTGHRILERYGATETMVMTSNPLDGERRPGTVGVAVPGTGVRIGADPEPVADGEQQADLDREGDGEGAGPVEVQGPSVFAGYWRRPDLHEETFTADGWYRTGDVGRLDEDGYLHLVGRSKDLIISGGLNVYPKEVEDALDALRGVDESAVIGLPDADFGEAVVAVVVPEVGAALDSDQLRAELRGHLAAFKVPKRVVLVDALPRNVMGKVEKHRLRTELGPAAHA